MPLTNARSSDQAPASLQSWPRQANGLSASWSMSQPPCFVDPGPPISFADMPGMLEELAGEFDSMLLHIMSESLRPHIGAVGQFQAAVASVVTHPAR